MAATAVVDIGGPHHSGTRVFTATADPTVDNSSANAHQVGDIIINTATKTAFLCLSAAAGAAVWVLKNVEYETFTWTPASVDTSFFQAIRPCTVIGAIARVDTAGTDASAVTGVLKKVPSGTAVSGGTALHTGSINLKGTANTNQALALSATPSDLVLNAGDSIGLDFTGVLTVAVGSATVLIVSN